jgi:pimeloyl-ACP methyl ester carboxylesterase
VLALHGWRRERGDFRNVLEGLDAVAIDLPGFGASPPPPEAWGASDYAARVATVLREMADPVVVVGHSFGGRVAVHLAASHPARVAGVVLAGVPLLRLTKPPGPSMRYRIARQLHQWGVITDARMEARRHRSGSNDYRAATGVMRDVFVHLVNETYEDELREITCPVELVWGSDDTAAPVAVAERAVELLAHPALTVLPGAGHLTPLTAPGELRAAIDRLLAPKTRRP